MLILLQTQLCLAVLRFSADTVYLRTFLALVQQETKKKRLAVRAANMYLDKFDSSLKGAEESLKRQLEDLEGTRYRALLYSARQFVSDNA